MELKPFRLRRKKGVGDVVIVPATCSGDSSMLDALVPRYGDDMSETLLADSFWNEDGYLSTAIDTIALSEEFESVMVRIEMDDLFKTVIEVSDCSIANIAVRLRDTRQIGARMNLILPEIDDKQLPRLMSAVAEGRNRHRVILRQERPPESSVDLNRNQVNLLEHADACADA